MSKINTLQQRTAARATLVNPGGIPHWLTLIVNDFHSTMLNALPKTTDTVIITTFSQNCKRKVGFSGMKWDLPCKTPDNC